MDAFEKQVQTLESVQPACLYLETRRNFEKSEEEHCILVFELLHKMR